MWPFSCSEDKTTVKQPETVSRSFKFTLRDGTEFLRVYEWPAYMDIYGFMSSHKSSGFIWDGKDTYYPISDVAKIFQF